METKGEPRETPRLIRTMDAAFFTILIGSSTRVVRLGVSETGDGSDKIVVILICAAYGAYLDVVLPDLILMQSRQFYEKVLRV